MKTIEQYFPMVLFTMLYKVVLTFWVYAWNPKSVTIGMKSIEQ